MEKKKLIYELGRWSDAYFARRSSEITHFFCWKCKRSIHGISMYEHLSKCSPAFFKRISKPKDKKMVQQFFGKVEDGSWGKLTRKVEVDYAEQTSRSDFDLDGVSSTLQDEVLQTKPEEDSGAYVEDSWDKGFSSKPEPVSKVIGRILPYKED